MKKKGGEMIHDRTEHRLTFLKWFAAGVFFIAISTMGTAFSQSSSSLQSILNPDGSVNAAVIHGSFNAHGYSMTLAKDGSPRFMKAQSDPNDVNWDGSFTVPGVGGFLNVIAINGNYLYVGGSFGTVGNVIAHNIAKFNLTGGTWSALDSAGLGTDGQVWSIAFNGADIYVGGSFLTAGTVSVAYIAKWNATSGWSALGTGLNGFAYGLLYSGGGLYVTGDFTQAGGNTANHIAKWDGTTWSALGSGLSGDGYWGLVVAGGNLYVAGGFATAGGTTVNNIAMWNGTVWSALGSGTPGTNDVVYDIAVSGDTVLYVGGGFTQAGGSAASKVARYSIATDSWSALGGGINGSYVIGVAIDGNNLYVGGDFTTAGIVSANMIAKWDISTSSWSGLGAGLNGYVYRVAISAGTVYAGGYFTQAGTRSAYGVASWDGTTWSPLSLAGGKGSVGGGVSAIAVRGDSVFIGGSFETAGTSPALNIAIWNRTTGEWSSLDATPTLEGVNGEVLTILPVATGDVYIGGSFSQAGSVTGVYNIVKWNPSTGWTKLGTGTNNSVYGMAIVSSNLYVCGSFSTAGGNTANRVAQWNGANWSALGSGLSSTGYAVVLAGGKIYVGGAFGMAGGNLVNNIASWDGSTWTALGTAPGTDSHVYAIAVCGDTALYVGGSFANAGGSPASGIAKYSIAGDSWSSLSGGLGSNNDVRALAVSGDTVIAGGYFTTAGLLTANSIAVWNISTKTWSPVGSGTDGPIYAVATGMSSDLYVGGGFSLAGGKPSYRFGRYNPNLTPVNEPPTQPKRFAVSQNYPNPFNPATSIRYELAAKGHVTLKVYDILGRQVASLVDAVQSPGQHDVVFDGSRLASGVYFYRITTGTFVQTMKMVLMK